MFWGGILTKLPLTPFLAFQTRRCCYGYLDWRVQETCSWSTIWKWWTVLQCWVWAKLHTCPLPESKNGFVFVGEDAERTQTWLLWLRFRNLESLLSLECNMLCCCNSFLCCTLCRSGGTFGNHVDLCRLSCFIVFLFFFIVTC